MATQTIDAAVAKGDRVILPAVSIAEIILSKATKLVFAATRARVSRLNFAPLLRAGFGMENQH